MRHHRHHRQARWLHTRISEPLEDALKREARRRRLPVSLLVRNVLEGALDLVEDIVESSFGVRDRRDEGLDDVYGWQELILNRGATCVRCERGLGAGAKSYRGLRDHTGPPIFLCVSCVGRLREPAAAKEEDPR